MRKAQWTKIVMPMENVPARKMLSETSAIQLLKHSMTSLIQKVHIQIWQLSAQSKSWVATQGSSMSLGSLLYIFYCNWHELRKQEKCSFLAHTRSKFYKTQWAWQGVKLTQMISIFTSKKVWKFFIQIQADKIQSQNDKGGKSALSHAN